LADVEAHCAVGAAGVGRLADVADGAEVLAEAGLADSPRKRVIAEPFSRYLRGVRPAFLEVSAAYLKASLLFDAFDAGRSEVMPFVLGAHDVGVRPFATIARDDRVEAAFLPLLDRLGLPRFQALVRERFAAGGA
jgi:hypothetical protein